MRFDPEISVDNGPNIDSLLRANFPTEFEANLVRKLRTAERMCAEHGLWDKGALVGYIGYSRVHIEGMDSKREIWGLGPMAVDTEHQRQGIGGKFLQESLAAIEADALVLLGHTSFYNKVGFQPAADFGLTYSDNDAQNAHFMALECWKGALEGHAGRVVYERVFYDE
ncbi:GNAT family N-acetyltransferase [Kordiimonas sp.]|uniref:GNAT family N-acetyltransferase n=1 Tax=Kordiimonas sp. TaxID=1970157 RepID=UPI003A90B269